MIQPNYVCPQRLQRNDIPFLMCKKQLKKPFEEYKTLKDCEQLICGHEYFCNRVNRWENTQGARSCPYNKDEG